MVSTFDPDDDFADEPFEPLPGLDPTKAVEWRSGGDCPACGEGLLVHGPVGVTDRGMPTYHYRCPGCGRRGDWAQYAKATHPGRQQRRRPFRSRQSRLRR